MDGEGVGKFAGPGNRNGSQAATRFKDDSLIKAKSAMITTVKTSQSVRDCDDSVVLQIRIQNEDLTSDAGPLKSEDSCLHTTN